MISQDAADWHARHGATLHLQMHVALGCPVHIVCEDAQRVANQLHADVSFQFNDIRLVARPGGDVLRTYQQKTARPGAAP